MTKQLFTLLAALALAGCATCERHPTFCAIGTAVVVGSVAATIAANDHHRDTQRVPPCQKINGVCVP